MVAGLRSAVSARNATVGAAGGVDPCGAGAAGVAGRAAAVGGAGWSRRQFSRSPGFAPVRTAVAAAIEAARPYLNCLHRGDRRETPSYRLAISGHRWSVPSHRLRVFCHRLANLTQTIQQVVNDITKINNQVQQITQLQNQLAIASTACNLGNVNDNPCCATTCRSGSLQVGTARVRAVLRAAHAMLASSARRRDGLQPYGPRWRRAHWLAVPRWPSPTKP